MIQSQPCSALALLPAIGLAALAGAVQAAPAAPGAMAAIHQFTDDFNRGDIAGAKAAHAADVAIIDEIPPHAWRGPNAFDTWVADLGKASKAAGQTDEKVTLGKTIQSMVDGDMAYVVTRVVYTYKEHGKRMVEPAEWTFAVHDEVGGWKITAWTWSGTVPHAVAAKAKAPAAPAAAPKT